MGFPGARSKFLGSTRLPSKRLERQAAHQNIKAAAESCRGPRSPVYAVTYSPDGRLIASAEDLTLALPSAVFFR
jgi:hypothetical protein